MTYHSPIEAHPLARLTSAVLDGGAYAYSDKFNADEWAMAAMAAADGDYTDLEYFAARDLAASEYPLGDIFSDGPDFDAWFAPNESYWTRRITQIWQDETASVARPAESFVLLGEAA